MEGALVAVLFPFVFIAFVFLLLFLSGIFVVQQQQEYIIERFGRFNRTALPGLHVKIPFVERIASKVDLRTRQTAMQIDGKTKDNVTITMTVAAQYHVNYDRGADPTQSGVFRSYYMLADPEDQMRAYIADALRSAIPNYDLDAVFDNKDSIAADVNTTVAARMVGYGYDLVSTLITSIGLPADVEASMNKINSAQREKEAAQALADADRIKVVVEAQAQAQAMEESGRGIAAQRKAIAEGIAGSLDVIRESGVSTREANQLFLFTQWAEMMGEFAKKGNSSTVVLPNDFNQTSSMFEQMLAANKADDNQ
ncbi:MAG: SPFH domain-containing protein [Denitrobacterium detoxificans]|nr:SPFH domain-containing protein [Denitrobacterium detoxificans]